MTRKFRESFCRFGKKHYLCGRVSPTRPAPPELRQVLIEATVLGCSERDVDSLPFFYVLLIKSNIMGLHLNFWCSLFWLICFNRRPSDALGFLDGPPGTPTVYRATNNRRLTDAWLLVGDSIIIFMA